MASCSADIKTPKSEINFSLLCPSYTPIASTFLAAGFADSTVCSEIIISLVFHPCWQRALG
jgi:hypothetical protein